MAQLAPGDRPGKVHPVQAKKARLFYLLALLPGCSYQQNHTRPDKPGVLQRVRNMRAGVPGTGYNHGR